jgi:short-subunit dehydrogenase
MIESRRPTALVTGASSGIGAATARALARAGYGVGLVARRAERLDELAEAIRAAGGLALPVVADLREAEQIEAMAERVRAELGPIDVLVNNAGVGAPHRAWRASEAIIEGVIGTNLIAPVRVARAVVPQMVERRRGHIINIGSVAAHVAMPGNSLYSASKAALRVWSMALGRELRPSRVSVSLIAPGYIRTEMTQGVRFWPMAGPDLIARAVLRVVRRPRRELIVPGYYTPLTWLDWFAPGLLDLASTLMGRRAA